MPKLLLNPKFMKASQLIKSIPNSITLLNLIFGCLSIVSAFEGNILLASYLILAASVFDFADGFTARLLKAYSPLGKELDSLSDMVSFGVAPSVLAFHLLKNSLHLGDNSGFTSGHFILVVPFLIAIFSALRLAKFNIDTKQTTSFIGLPTPANALLFAGLVIGLHGKYAEYFEQLSGNPYIFATLIIIQSALLVLPIPMFSLKIKSLKPSESWRQLLLILGALMLFVLLGQAAIMPIIVLYIVLSVTTGWI